MRNTWVRAWIAAVGLLIAAAAVIRSRTSLLLKVEQPVMEWLLDGTDTSIWDRAGIFSSNWFLIGGTLLLAIVGMVLDIRVGFAVILTAILARVLTGLVGGLVGRVGPSEADGSSFPNGEIVNTGVFWGTLVIMLWWVGAPKLLWQIVLEVAIVINLVVSIRLIVAGEVWPSDAFASTIVIALSLITSAAVLEANPPNLPARNKAEVVAAA